MGNPIIKSGPQVTHSIIGNLVVDSGFSIPFSGVRSRTGRE